ncbi:hypothetical protein AK812_SmicGene44996 [Symbiodinium microadriaticum]|uniref:Uncharacterized protein n=1 Tax=Symbiodinium microadriaticum TaxID=2951 RepID=A0A1Q9BX36_SYMMI|nr:hypothetical protein AK812_SmicGene44996 [Symbiodinium microadriaticum]
MIASCCLEQQQRDLRSRGHSEQWKLQAAGLRQQWGVSLNARPWTSARHRLTGVPRNNRAHHCIDLAYLDHLRHRQPADMVGEEPPNMQEVFVDVSQMPARKTWTHPKKMGHRADVQVPAGMPPGVLRFLNMSQWVFAQFSSQEAELTKHVVHSRSGEEKREYGSNMDTLGA